MVSRVFLILVFIVANGMYSSSFTEEAPLQKKGMSIEILDFRKFVPQKNPKPGAQQPKSDSEKCEKYCEGIKEYLDKAYNDSAQELNKFNSYIGFGILIAIFLMERKFRFGHKCLVLFSSFFAISSLSMNYFGSAYVLNSSMSMYNKSNLECLQQEGSQMWMMSNCIFWVMVGTLLGAVILFCVLSYQYFFETSPRKSKGM